MRLEKWGNKINNFKNKVARNQIKNNISRKQIDIIKKELESIVVCEADKTKTVVLVNEQWEKEK